MLIGYENSKWQKIATKRHEDGVKLLSKDSADLVVTRLSQFAAFDNLAQIRCHAPPLHLHLLTRKGRGQANQQCEFAIKLRGSEGIVIRPAGEYVMLANGTPDANTVTQVVITFIGNYHDRQ